MNKTVNKHIWLFPWGMRESFVVVSGLLTAGFLIEYFFPRQNIQLPVYPFNLIILIFFIAFLFVTQIFIKKQILKWLSSVPAAVAGMTFFTLLLIIMGFIPQGEKSGFERNFGLNNIYSSKPFIIITVFMLTVLGYTIFRKLMQKINLRNIIFLIIHAGLFIIISAFSLSPIDLVRLKMPVYTEQTTNIAYPDDKHFSELPFSIYLKSFSVEEYNPEMIIFNIQTNEVLIKKGTELPSIYNNASGKILDYEFEVISYIPYAVPGKNKYVYSEQFGSTHAALIKIKHHDFQKQGWISCGNIIHKPKYLKLDEYHKLAMTTPKVKKYISVIDLISDKDTVKDAEIIVNKPLKFNGWKIYQSSYDTKLGRWAQYSIFELVSDPWLTAVYTGIFMLILGCLYLLWKGKKI